MRIIKDVSFIVIARNESFAVAKCLGSIASMPLKECEVICVDSDSTDNTLEVMKAYTDKIQNLKVIQCSGYLNSAVARNAGLRYATKEYIYFVDGDVELYPDFIYEALNKMESGKADAVTGILDEIVYSDGYERIEKPMSHRKYYPRVMEISHSGGIFLVTSQLAETVSPWDERMDKNQDIDFTLRLHRHGRLLALPITMCMHHTLAYNERPWLFLKKRSRMCFGMLIRKNFNQPKAILLLLKQYRGFLAGVFVYLVLLVGILITCILSQPFYYLASIVWLLVVSDLVWGAVRNENVINRFLTHYLHVPMIIAGIFFDANHNRPPTVVKRIC